MEMDSADRARILPSSRCTLTVMTNVHLILAEDEFLAGELVARLRTAMPPDTEEIRLDPESGDLPNLEEALFAQSLFASERFVVIEQAERLQAAGIKRLYDALARTPPATIAVIAVSERVPAALLKAVQTFAKTHRVPRPKRGELVNWVAKRLQAAGATHDRESPGLLVEALGSNLHDLARAIDQLTTRTNTVTKDDVHAHFPRVAEQPVWALFDALGQGDGRKAFRVLHALLDHGEDAIAILFPLVSQIRYVMRAKSAVERSPSLNESQLAQALGVSPGRAAVLRRQSARLSWEWLLRMHRLAAEADFDLKGGDEVRIVGVLPPEIVLERLVDAALPATETVPG
jgi:DNA polymerase-3 subunit delta